MAPIKQ